MTPPYQCLKPHAMYGVSTLNKITLFFLFILTVGFSQMTLRPAIINVKEATVTDKVPEEYFADLISNVSHANGVFRLTFAQRETADNVRPVVRILIPANQLQNALRSITGAANEIREKVQAQIEDNSENNAAMGEPAASE